MALYDFYSSPDVIRKNYDEGSEGMGTWHVLWRCTYRALMGNREGKRQVRRPRLRRQDNIKMNFNEIEWENVNWICLAYKVQELQEFVKKYWTIGFYNTLENSELFKEFLAA